MISKKIDEQMLLRVQPIITGDKTINDIKNIIVEIKLLDKDKNPLTKNSFIDKIPKVEKTSDVQDILDKYKSKFTGEYIIKYETNTKEIAKRLEIDETNKKYKQIAFLSFWIDADGNGVFTAKDGKINKNYEEWVDVRICQELVTKEMLYAMGCEQKVYDDKVLIEALNKYCCQYEINTPLRIAHFLSQCGHESNGFTKFVEDTEYRESKAIENSCYKKYRETVGKNIVLKPMIKNGKKIDEYCKQPEYFNCKYGGVLGNLKTNPNDPTKQYYYQIEDGHTYRGRGLIQITRRSAYKNFTQRYNAKYPNDKQDFETNPDLVKKLKYAVASACDYWRNNGIKSKNKDINTEADKGSDDSVVLTVSKEVNGYGQTIPNGYNDPNKKFTRLQIFKNLKKYMNL